MLRPRRSSGIRVRSNLLPRLTRLAAAGIAALLLVARPAPAATDIALWHAMPGELGYQIEKLAEGFNASQRDYRVVQGCTLVIAVSRGAGWQIARLL